MRVLQAFHWLVSLGISFVRCVHPHVLHTELLGVLVVGKRHGTRGTGEAASPALAFAGSGTVVCFLLSVKSSTLKLCGRRMQLYTKEGTLHFPMQLRFFRHYLRDPILTSHTPMLVDTGESYSLLKHARSSPVAIPWFNSKKDLSSSILA